MELGGSFQEPKGNPVKSGAAPATVNGDETCTSHCLVSVEGREGAGIRMTRKPGNLPGQ